MPIAPTSGIPPRSTLEQFDRTVATFTPYYIAPGLTQKNFYAQNGQIILAAMVALLLIILFVLNSVIGIGPPTIFSQS